MATDIAALQHRTGALVPNRHAVSPGLWVLAWRRLKSDTVGMVALAITIGTFSSCTKVSQGGPFAIVEMCGSSRD